MPVRAPHLHAVLRGFCLGAFGLLSRDVEDGAEVPFAFEEHASPARPSLYEYRPLVRPFLDDRAEILRGRTDARVAVAELRREPAAAIFARAHAGPEPSEEHALFRTVLLPLLAQTAEAAGGFDWKDDAFERAYAQLEVSLFGAHRAYSAVAPVVGLSLGGTVELGGGVRVRHAAAGELSSHWPEANGLLPPRFGREIDRVALVELRRELRGADVHAPDAPGEIADAVTALRLATAGAIAAGPVLFERLDLRPFGIRPVLPIAATLPPGESTRLDRFRGEIAAQLRERLVLADDDPELGEALDRWELALLAPDATRAEQLREALAVLLGNGDGLWAAALRASVLLGDTARGRGELLEELRADATPDVVRRALVETLLHGDRVELVRALDDAVLGLRPRPASAGNAA